MPVGIEDMTRSRLLKYARSSPKNLSANGKHRFAADHALRVYQSNAIYSFIPKNACSTMRLSLAIANCCIKDALDVNWIHQNNSTFAADLEALIRADYTFVVLRDPFARLVSCFLDKIVGKDQGAWKLYDLIDRRQSLDEITFADFTACLRSRATRNADIHWRPQVDFLVYEQYDDYFCVENFQSDANAIKNKSRLEIVDARKLTKHGLDRYQLLSADLDFSATPAAEIAELRRRGESPHPRSLYTTSLVQIVSNLYAADISLYAEKIGLPTLVPATAKPARTANEVAVAII